MMEDIYLALPLLVLSIGAFILLLWEVAGPMGKETDNGTGLSRELITAFTLVAALSTVVLNGDAYETGRTIFSGILFLDPFVRFISVLLIGGSLIALFLGINHLSREGIKARGEFYSVFLMSLVGAVILISSAEMITFFLGLEIMSMALYCLCGASITGKELSLRRSSESALKYFLLGSFASAFLLYGIALAYGLTGSTTLTEIAAKAGSVDTTMLLLAIGLVMVGVTFKIGAVPFHFWAPDVYQGAPTSITAYMACIIKSAAVAAGLRVFWLGFHSQIIFWSGPIWTIALITMVVGNLVALRQRSIKRMLAYSSIAHAGYMLMAFLAPGAEAGGGAAILFYLVAYTAMTIGAFAVVLAVTASDNDLPQGDDIVRFNGLGTTRPVLGALMALFMLSLAGIPPGMAGLLGKYYLFASAVRSDYVGLAIVGILSSAVSCYYYLRVIVAMYFVEADSSGPKNVAIGAPLGGVLALCALGVILLGIFPEGLHAAASIAVQGM